MQSGLVTRIFDWGTHPAYSEGTPSIWFAGLVMVMILAFLWSMVIRSVE